MEKYRSFKLYYNLLFLNRQTVVYILDIRIRRKSSYLLLETIIALILLFTCALKFLTNPIESYRLEMQNMYKGDFERIAELSFAEIKEKLYKQEFSFKELRKKQHLQLENVTINLVDEKKLVIGRSYTICIKDDKIVDKGKMIFAKVGIKINLYQINNDNVKKKYSFNCFITKAI